VIRRVHGDDPRVLEYAHVGNHAWLSERGLFVAEGRLLVDRLIAAGNLEILSVLATPAAARALEGSLARAAADVLVVEPAVINGVTGFNFHRGCLALARRPRDVELADLPHTGCLVGLEAVGNPDNIGGLFRTAAAFGVAGVLLDRTSGDPFYRKALRTSMGAVLHLPFVRVADWTAAIAALSGEGRVVVALTPRSDALTLEEFARSLSPTQPRVLLVGSEGAGLSDATLSLADARVRIPITHRIDSLNVTVAAGIALARLAT
jgi:tRNA G18 (ribose-2'-O)-methylase SpoU